MRRGRSQTTTKHSASDERNDVLARLRGGMRVRRALHPWGRLNIDRPLPFLCVYRRPAGRDDPATDQLATGVSSYLTASGAPSERRGVTDLVSRIASELSEEFGAFLLIEIWSRAAPEIESPARSTPGFQILAARTHGIPGVIDELETSLSRIDPIDHEKLGVEVVRARQVAPPGLPQLLSAEASARMHCEVLGLEIPPVYVDPGAGTVFPVVQRRLRKALAGVLNRTAYRFTRAHTTHRPPHYHALGRRSFTKAAMRADEALASLSGEFDFLLLTTPRNTEEAWAAFRRSRFERAPEFSYRPRPFDVALAKRRLYAIPIERIEDPTLSDLFREQQEEIDRKLTMVADRGTPRFRYEGIQLFGHVDDTLLKQAVDILDRIPSRARESSKGGKLDAKAFAARAAEEIKFLRQQHDRVTAKVQIRSDVTGLLVSGGNLLVGATNAIPATRVEALLQHEVGTHVLTYYNGLAQPFRQLRSGLAGYEELQEALAVLAEYLVGGLSRPRLRLLAARVLAVRRMLDGASFVEVYRELDRNWDLSQRVAFTTTMRVFRGGGHAKDAVYLRGLLRLLDYLRDGKPLDPLYVGKIGLHHLPIVEELSLRHALKRVPLRPRYLDRPDVQERLERLRTRVSLLELAREALKRRRGRP